MDRHRQNEDSNQGWEYKIGTLDFLLVKNLLPVWMGKVRESPL